MALGNKIECTVGILTFNSANSLEQTLRAVSDFSEVIVCDGGSTDNTLDIARRYGCKIISQDPKFKRGDGKIKDFAGVRNQMLDSASYKWFFYVDSDELLSSPLIEEIGVAVLNLKKPTAFWIPRKYVVDGLVIDCASTYPSKQMRLFHRDGVNSFIKTIHERIDVKLEAVIAELDNFMLIPMTTDISAIQRKWDYYLDLEEERIGKMTLALFLKSCFQNIKISALYIFRFIRNIFFCKGNKMPFTLEMQRHVYHINMCKRFFKMLFR